MTHHSPRLVTGVTLLAIAIGACSPAPGSQPTAQAVQASAASAAAGTSAIQSPAPLPTPSQDEIRAAAAKAYRTAVIPSNREGKALWAYYKDKTSLKANRAYCTKLAANQRTLLLAMKAIVWPTDTASDAKILIRALASDDANMRTCAKAGNWAEWNRAWDLHNKASARSHEAANLVRLDLGLQPVPG